MNFSGKPFVCIKPCDSQYGVVGVNRMGFFCCTCSIVRSACVHIGCLKEVLHKENESLPDFILEMESLRYDMQQTGPKPNCYLPKAISACKVTWKTTPCQQKIYNFQSERAPDNPIKLSPPDIICPSCSSEVSELVYPVQKKLFLRSNYVTVEG